jgi:hypothetical protein
MVVHPSQKQLLRTELVQVSEFLSIHQKRLQIYDLSMLRWQNSRLFFTWIEREIDVGEETHSDNLPKKTENEMLAGFEQILGTDVDHGATDSGGGIDCKVEIFLFSVNALF